MTIILNYYSHIRYNFISKYLKPQLEYWPKYYKFKARIQLKLVYFNKKILIEDWNSYN